MVEIRFVGIGHYESEDGRHRLIAVTPGAHSPWQYFRDGQLVVTTESDWWIAELYGLYAIGMSHAVLALD